MLALVYQQLSVRTDINPVHEAVISGAEHANPCTKKPLLEEQQLVALYLSCSTVIVRNVDTNLIT